MKETDKVLSEVLQKALSVAEKTGQFAVDQVPDLIKQLLVWKAVENGLQLLIGLSLFYTGYRIYKWTDKQVSEGGYGCEWIDQVGSIFSIGISLMIGAFLFFGGLFPLVKILVAPKIYLIEYAASLIK